MAMQTMSQFVELESELQRVADKAASTAVSTTASQLANNLLDIIKVFKLEITLVPFEIDGKDLNNTFETIHEILTSAVELAATTTLKILSLDEMHQTTVGLVTHCVEISELTNAVKQNLKLLERFNEKLVDVIVIASHSLNASRIENALDATSVISNTMIRNFWIQRIGKNVDRVDVSFFIQRFQDHVKEIINERRKSRVFNEEKVNDGDSISEILFSRMLLNLLTASDRNKQISVHDVTERLSGFRKDALDFASSTANHALEAELAYLSKIEFLPVQDIEDCATTKRNYKVLQKGDTGLYHGDKIIKTTPLQRVPIYCNVPKFTSFLKGGVTLVRYEDVKRIDELSEKSNFKMTEMSNTRAYLSASSNNLYVDGEDTSNWNTVVNLGHEEFINVTPSKTLTTQFSSMAYAVDSGDVNNKQLKQIGVEKGVQFLYTPTVQTPGIYSVRNFLEEGSDDANTENGNFNGTRYLFNNISNSVLEQFDSRDFFFQPITIKGIGVRNMYQYVEVVISLLCMDLHRAIQQENLSSYNATNRFVNQFMNNISQFVNAYRNDPTSVKDIGILPVVKISWTAPMIATDKGNNHHIVKLFGSFNNWSTSNRIEMQRIGNEENYSYVARLFPGRYLFKFEVDGKELISADYPCLDFHGMKVNYLDVSVGQTIGRLTRNTTTEKPESPTVEVDFKWEEGGDDVQLIGSFTDWSVPVRMVKSSLGKFFVKVLLCEGHHQYRFIVDGRIRVATHHANVHDSLGNINNVVYVSKNEDENPIHCHFAVEESSGNKVAAVFFESSLLGCEDGLCDEDGELENASGDALSVTGSFLNWEKSLKMMKNNGKGLFATKKPVNLPLGKHDYVFIIDGMWKYDPLLPFRQDERGNILNFLVVRQQVGEDISAKSTTPQTPVAPAVSHMYGSPSLYNKRKMLFTWGPVEYNVHKRVSVLVRGEGIHERLSMTYAAVDKVFSCVADLPLGQYDYKYIIDGEYRLACEELIKINKDVVTREIELVNYLVITEADIDYLVPESSILPNVIDDLHPMTPLTAGNVTAITPQSVRGMDHSHRSPIANAISGSVSPLSGYSAPAKTHAYSPPPNIALAQRVMVEFDVTTTIPQTKEVLLVGSFSSQSDLIGAEMDRSLDFDNKYHKSMSVVLGEQFVYHYEIDGVRTYSPDQVLVIDPYTKQVKNFMICGESLFNGHKRRIGDVWHVAHEFKFEIADTERIPDSVYLTGSFIGWEKDHILMARHGRLFKTTLMLPPGKYEYNFFVDGQWRSSADDELLVVREKSLLGNNCDEQDVVKNAFSLNVLFVSDGAMLDEITGLQALDNVAMAAIQIRAMKQFQAFMTVSAHTTTTELLTRCADIVDRLTALARQMSSDPIDRAKAQYLLDKFPGPLLKKENFLILEQMLSADINNVSLKREAVLLVLKIYRFFDLVDLLDGVHRFSKHIMKAGVEHLPFLFGVAADQLECCRNEYRTLLDLFLIWGNSINQDVEKINTFERRALLLNDHVDADQLNELAKSCLVVSSDVDFYDRLYRDFYFVKMLMIEIASKEAFDTRSIDALRLLSEQATKLQELFLKEKSETDSNDCCSPHAWLKTIFFIQSNQSQEEVAAARTKKLVEAMKRDYVNTRNAQFGKDLSRSDVLEVATRFRFKLLEFSQSLESPASQREVPLLLPRTLALLTNVQTMTQIVDEWIATLQKRPVLSSDKLLFSNVDEVCDNDILGADDFDKYLLAVIGILKGYKWRGDNICKKVGDFMKRVKEMIVRKKQDKLTLERKVNAATSKCYCSAEVKESDLNDYNDLSETLQALLSDNLSILNALRSNTSWRNNSLFQYKPPHPSSLPNYHNALFDEERVSRGSNDFSGLLDTVQKAVSSHKGDFDSFFSRMIDVASPQDVLDRVRFLHSQILTRLDHYRQLHKVLCGEATTKPSGDEVNKFFKHEQLILSFFDETLHMLHTFLYSLDLLQIILKLRKEVDGTLTLWRQTGSPLPSASSKYLDNAERKLLQIKILAKEFHLGITGVANRVSDIDALLRSDFESWLWEGEDHQQRHDIAIAAMVKDTRFHQLSPGVKSLLNRTISVHMRVGLLDAAESTKCGDFARVSDSVARLAAMSNDLLDSFLQKTCFLCPSTTWSRQEVLFEFGTYLLNALSPASKGNFGNAHFPIPTASIAPHTLSLWGDLEIEMSKTPRSRDLVRDIKNATNSLMMSYRRYHAVKELIDLRGDIEAYISRTLTASLTTVPGTEKSQELNAFILDLLHRVAEDLSELIEKAALETPSFGLRSLLDEDRQVKPLLPHGLLIHVEDVHSLVWGQTSIGGGKSTGVVFSNDSIDLRELVWRPLVSMDFPFQVVSKLSIAHEISAEQAQNTRIALCHYVSAASSSQPCPTTLIARSEDRDEIVAFELNIQTGVTEITLSSLYNLLQKSKSHRVFISLGVGRKPLRDSPVVELDMVVVDTDCDENAMEDASSVV